MEIYKVKTDDNNFEFQFEFIQDESGFIVSVNTKIYYIDKLKDYVKILKFEKYNSLPEEKIQFDIRDCNGYVLYGFVTLKIVKSYDGTYAGIWSNFYYGEKLRPIEFEGFLIYIPAKNPGPSPPEPPLPEVKESHSVNVNIQNDLVNDLFPYVYMRKWPGINKDDLKYNFVEYSELQLSPPGNYLIDDLISDAGNREKMVEDSISFIEGDGTYYPCYINNIGTLTAPFNKIYSFYKELEKPITDTEEELKERILIYFELDIKEFREFLNSNEYKIEKEICWQSYFALIFTMGYNLLLLNQLTEILVCSNLFEVLFQPKAIEITITNLNKLIKATICLPDGLFPKKSPPDDIALVYPYAIGDLQLVKQKFLRYELGEISEIINVMKGEEKEIRNRTLTRDEEITENKQIKENLKTNIESDFQTDLSEQIFKTITDNSKTVNYSDLKTTYGPPNVFTYSGSVTYTDPDSETKDNSKYAKEIIHKAVSSINSNISNLRKQILTNETEKLIISRIDNRNSEVDYSGIYRWVNKIYNNYVVNYGIRLMYQLQLQQPANQFINSELLFEGENFNTPVNPVTMGVKQYTDITRDNFNQLSLVYNNLTNPPPSEVMVSESINGSETTQVKVPDGYEAVSVAVAVISSDEIKKENIQIAVGTTLIQIDNGKGTADLSKETGKIPIAAIETPVLVSPPNTIGEFLVNVVITCTLSDNVFSKWQVKVFNEIYSDYKQQLENYYQNISDKFGNTNNEKNVLIVKQSVIQCCKQEIYKNYLIKCGKSLKDNNHADFRVLQYIDMLFEWNEIYFVFIENFSFDPAVKNYPLIDQFKNYGEFFTQFLKADYARVILPVRSGYELPALLFTETGIMWDANPSLCCSSSSKSNNDGPAEIINEIKKSVDVKRITIISDPWEIKIPTDMQMLNNSNPKILELKK